MRHIIKVAQAYSKNRKHEKDQKLKAEMFSSFILVRKVCMWWRKYTRKRLDFWQCNCRAKKY